jgi:hypothetical protein
MSLLSSYVNNIDNVAIGEVAEVIPSKASEYTTDGYLQADGSILSQATYPDLYNKIGLIQDGLDSWTARILSATSFNGDVLYGNNSFVVGITSTSPAGNLVTSTDGITWSYSSTSTAVTTRYYGNGTYFGTDASNSIQTSTNATTWTKREANAANTINSITYGNGLYLYGTSGTIDTVGTSTDGQTWFSIGPSHIDAIQVAYGNSRYVAAGATRIGTSTDSIRWTGTDVANTPNSLVYGNATFVYGTYSGDIVTSTDGLTTTII